MRLGFALQRIGAGLLALLLFAPPLAAAEFVVQPTVVEDLKSVFGRVEARDVVLARSRIGGSILSIDVDEGSAVTAGQVIAVVGDEKLKLRLDSIGAAIRSVSAQLDNAKTELDRGEKLFATNVIAKSRLDQLRTQVDVLGGQLNGLTAERAIVVQQAKEGQVLAPAKGRVLEVPVTPNSVVMAGDPVARIGGGGYYLRIALPERHAAQIKQGMQVRVGARGFDDPEVSKAIGLGRIVKVYPELDNGHILADVEVEGLGDFFVGERIPVWISVASRRIVAVPPEALSVRYGIDYVRVASGAGSEDVAVVVGRTFDTADGPRTEILTGLSAGDRLVLP